MAAATMSLTVQAVCVAARPAKSTFLAGRALVSSRVGPSARQARSSVIVAADRPTWYPGATPPKYLDGSIPGDYGFDPLRLGQGDKLKWFQEAELYNGRWAMMAVAGILFQEAVGKGHWWTAGARVDLPLPLPTLIAVEIAVFAVLEYRRVENWKKTGTTGFLNMAPFDPAGMKSKEMEVKEIKNARLAMLAFLGFTSQAAVNGQGPLEALQSHLADPAHNNIYTSPVGNEFTIAVIAASIFPIVVEVRKNLSGRDDDEFRPIPFT